MSDDTLGIVFHLVNLQNYLLCKANRMDSPLINLFLIINYLGLSKPNPRRISTIKFEYLLTADESMVLIDKYPVIHPEG